MTKAHTHRWTPVLYDGRWIKVCLSRVQRDGMTVPCGAHGGKVIGR